MSDTCTGGMGTPVVDPTIMGSISSMLAANSPVPDTLFGLSTGEIVSSAIL